jgi:hypothetical protein
MSQAGGERYPAEPGLDVHEWLSQWASVEADLSDDPGAGLSQLADIVGRALAINGYVVDDAVARSGEEPEIVTTYLSARETAERAEVGEASRADVEQAIDDLREVVSTLLRESGLET